MFFSLIISAWLDTYNPARYHLNLHFAFHLQPKKTPRQTANDGLRSHKGTETAIDQPFKENIQLYWTEKMAWWIADGKVHLKQSGQSYRLLKKWLAALFMRMILHVPVRHNYSTKWLLINMEHAVSLAEEVVTVLYSVGLKTAQAY